jgi:hypothetical protein
LCWKTKERLENVPGGGVVDNKWKYMTVNLSLIVGHIRELEKTAFCKVFVGVIDGGGGRISEARRCHIHVMNFRFRITKVYVWQRLEAAHRRAKGQADAVELFTCPSNRHRLSWQS